MSQVLDRLRFPPRCNPGLSRRSQPGKGRTATGQGTTISTKTLPDTRTTTGQKKNYVFVTTSVVEIAPERVFEAVGSTRFIDEAVSLRHYRHL
jgi:hypothetical protein